MPFKFFKRLYSDLQWVFPWKNENRDFKHAKDVEQYPNSFFPFDFNLKILGSFKGCPENVVPFFRTAVDEIKSYFNIIIW